MARTQEIVIIFRARDLASSQYMKALRSVHAVWLTLPHWNCRCCEWRGRNPRRTEDGPFCPECGFTVQPDIKYPDETEG